MAFECHTLGCTAVLKLLIKLLHVRSTLGQDDDNAGRSCTFANEKRLQTTLETRRPCAPSNTMATAASQQYSRRACITSDQLSGHHLPRPFMVSHRMRKRMTHVVQAGTVAPTSPVQQAKSKLSQLAGRKYGHNLTENQKQDVRGVIKQLEALQSGDMRKQELAGSNWQLLYTESTGSSGGKVGPFVGQVDQAKCC